VLDLGVKPDIPKDKWIFTIDGFVEKAVRWNWEEFLAQPQVTMTSDIHCVTGWSRYDNAGTGVHAAHLLDLCKPEKEAMHCLFYSSDGYTTNIRLDRFADEDVLLAHSWNGEYLTKAHGGPVRAVVPKWYFWKSAKWLGGLNFFQRKNRGSGKTAAITTKEIPGKRNATVSAATLFRGYCFAD
jgi:DMSO/TMAO reductase YedYZ molybdopterin-dependent catalytic subunit